MESISYSPRAKASSSAETRRVIHRSSHRLARTSASTTRPRREDSTATSRCPLPSGNGGGQRTKPAVRCSTSTTSRSAQHQERLAGIGAMPRRCIGDARAPGVARVRVRHFGQREQDQGARCRRRARRRSRCSRVRSLDRHRFHRPQRSTGHTRTRADLQRSHTWTTGPKQRSANWCRFDDTAIHRAAHRPPHTGSGTR